MRPYQTSQRHFTLRQAAIASHHPLVLVADDDAEMRSIISDLLTDEGYEVETVRDGKELLERLAFARATRMERLPDLIITDLRMPQLDGLDALRGIRVVDSDTPVLFLTAFGDDETFEEARRLGVAGMFPKPFNSEALRTAVLNLTLPHR